MRLDTCGPFADPVRTGKTLVENEPCTARSGERSEQSQLPPKLGVLHNMLSVPLFYGLAGGGPQPIGLLVFANAREKFKPDVVAAVEQASYSVAHLLNLFAKLPLHPADKPVAATGSSTYGVPDFSLAGGSVGVARRLDLSVVDVGSGEPWLCAVTEI